MLTLISNLFVDVISGLILLILTSFVHSIRKRFKNKEQISQANSKILLILKPIIAQQDLLGKGIIESVVRSVAREYELDCQSLLSIKDIEDDCIKEIEQNSFLTPNEKEEMIGRLSVNISKSKDISSRKNKTEKKRGKLAWEIICVLIFIILGTILQPFLEAKLTPSDTMVQLIFYICIAVVCVIGIILYAYRLFR